MSGKEEKEPAGKMAGAGKLRDFAPVPVRAALDSDLGAAALRVLILLSSHAGKDGTCFPYQSTLAKKLGLARPTINGHISRLETLGYIRRQRRKGEDGSEKSCLYHIIYAPLSDDQTPPVENFDASCRDIQQAVSALDTTPPVDSRADTFNRPIKQTNESLSADFEDFWAGWKPFEMAKGHKQPAKQKYEKARKEGISHETLIASRNIYINHCHATKCRTQHVIIKQVCPLWAGWGLFNPAVTGDVSVITSLLGLWPGSDGWSRASA